MSDSFMDNDIFALVKDGEIVEYPVYYSSIVNRAHPVDMYTKVTFEEKPVTPPFYYVPEKLVLVDGEVVLKYGVPEPISLDALLQRVTGPLLLEGMKIPVSSDLSNRIFELAHDNVEKLLNDFAKKKGYRDIVSAISYIGSTTPEFNDDGVFCRDLRDNVWATFYLYVNNILEGKVPYPNSWLEFSAHLPEMVWPNIEYPKLTEEAVVPFAELPEEPSA